ncbi:MAG: hypothetical protein ACLS55_07160 [Lachnospiraceae bacterium]
MTLRDIMTNINFQAIFPAMLFVVIVGIPLLLIKLFICSLKKEKYIKKAHTVRGKEVSHKFVNGYTDNDNRPELRRDEIWAYYTYEWRGKKYKTKIRWDETTYLNRMSKEVDLYFLKNPKRVAVNAAGLAEMQVHIVRTLVITFIIGFLIFY